MYCRSSPVDITAESLSKLQRGMHIIREDGCHIIIVKSYPYTRCAVADTEGKVYRLPVAEVLNGYKSFSHVRYLDSTYTDDDVADRALGHVGHTWPVSVEYPDRGERFCVSMKIRQPPPPRAKKSFLDMLLTVCCLM